MASTADICVYGGAAGGGKSWALLVEPLRHVERPNFRCVIFRRTSEQIRQSGGLWDKSSDLYPQFGAVGRENNLDWRFPSGATIDFEHLQYDKDKHNWQGAEIDLICFDELTHFLESQFWYLLSRNRSMSGVRPYMRATCNPDPGSFVARLLEWWIDQESGFPIQERSGVVRWFEKINNEIVWRDKPIGSDGEKSITFVPAKLEDNPTLLRIDPGYRANLLAQDRVQRARLHDGNWLVTEQTIIDPAWWKHYTQRGDQLVVSLGGQVFVCEAASLRRFATIDTAGTARDKSAAAKGKHSWSVVCVWDYHHAKNLLFLRHVWRQQVDWNELKARVPDVLQAWGVPRAYLENAHSGPALKQEIRGCQVELIGPTLPGMSDSNQGAKLDRAIASGVLNRIEDGLLFLPDGPFPWLLDYKREWSAWTGLPDEQADQIDCSSYASYVSKKQSQAWGGVVSSGGLRR